MAIPTTYTGQNSGAAPIYQGSKTEAALSQGVDRLLGAQKAQVNLAQKEAQDFRQAMQVDPIQVANNAVMGKQAAALKEYMDYGTQLMKERGGKLNEMDRLQLASMKSALKSNQSKWLANEDRYLTNVRNYTSRPGYYDPEAFEQAQTAYIGGDENAVNNMLQVAPASAEDMSNLFTQLGYRARGKGFTDDQVRGMIEAQLADDRVRKYAERAFSDLPQFKKEEYLKTGSADDVVDYMYETYAPYFKTPETKPRTTTSTAAERNAELERTANLPENLMKTGVSAKDTGYGWKQVGGDLTFQYKPTLKEDDKFFEVSAEGLDLPDNAVIEGGMIDVSPMKLSKGGELTVRIPTKAKQKISGNARDVVIRSMMNKGYLDYEEVGKKRNKKKVPKGNTGEISYDGYIYDADNDVLYELGEDVTYRQQKVPFEKVRQGVSGNFRGLDESFDWWSGESASEGAKQSENKAWSNGLSDADVSVVETFVSNPKNKQLLGDNPYDRAIEILTGKGYIKKQG